MDRLRVIVCGGRDYEDWDALDTFLTSFHAMRPIGHLWHGNARGADTMAGAWASHPGRAISVHPVPADWAKYGKRAGPIRNQNMLGQRPDVVIAFPGGRGTADMVARARKAGVEVIEVNH